MTEVDIRISQSELAELLGVSKQYVNKLVQQGKFPLRDGQLDKEECVAIYETMGGSKASQETESQNNIGQHYQKARAIKEANIAKIKAIELQQKELQLKIEQGKYISVEEAERSADVIFSELRNQLYSIPSRIALECVGKSAPKISSIMEYAINEALEAMQNWAKQQKQSEKGN